MKYFEETEDYIIWRVDENEKKGFTLELPKPPNNCGYFHVKFNSGLAYTVYGLEEMIDECFNNGDMVEAFEENQTIIFKRNLIDFLKENEDKTPEELAETLYDNYKIEEP